MTRRVVTRTTTTCTKLDLELVENKKARQQCRAFLFTEQRFSTEITVAICVAAGTVLTALTVLTGLTADVADGLTSLLALTALAALTRLLIEINSVPRVRPQHCPEVRRR